LTEKNDLKGAELVVDMRHAEFACSQRTAMMWTERKKKEKPKENVSNYNENDRERERQRKKEKWKR